MSAALPPPDMTACTAITQALVGRAIGAALASLACNVALAITALPPAQRAAALAAVQDRIAAELRLDQRCRAAIAAPTRMPP